MAELLGECDLCDRAVDALRLEDRPMMCCRWSLVRAATRQWRLGGRVGRLRMRWVEQFDHLGRLQACPFKG